MTDRLLLDRVAADAWPPLEVAEPARELYAGAGLAPACDQHFRTRPDRRST